MAYLPKNKYKKLYTKGNEFKLTTTGEAYTGEYIKLNDGRLFAGSGPDDLKGRLTSLYPIRNNNVLNNNKNNKIYSILQKELSLKQDTYIPIPASSPPPTAIDYSNGYYNRYISVRLNTKQYTEISKDVYENFSKRNYNKSLNKVFFVKWNLGENSEVENTKRLRQLEYDLPGIFNFFPNKGEYGIKNGIIRVGNSRIYTDGKVVPKNLPPSYQQNEFEERCAGCKFNQKGICNKWDAEIKKEFWCRAYEAKSNFGS